ncbi:hypothetical protein HS088_TW14G00758 [Tripterygium wilfordii]|uniref:Glycosyltransferase n=1 Tax=Tripterygium wilfordii TaxID=458696 RepID=A0A7J7CR79_TRIWF|nr:7-deoxyloganetic acid glucosyltransferase-like [Tripterygium wilfordii]KAF5736613.1 hypothetical protein HS088_TW14G00758 [Tripterygium wilfordii]
MVVNKKVKLEMELAANDSSRSPHVLIFPAPAQGHVDSMLKLSELLSLAGLRITFLNSDYNHNRLVRYTDVQARFAQYPGFQFKTIWDGLPNDHPRSGHEIMDVFDAMNSATKPLLEKMLTQSDPPVNCIIGDGIMGWVIDVAEQLDIPIIHFRTIGASCFWAYYCLHDTIEARQLPINGIEDMDRLITTVPGMETFLRCRDLPSFCRASDLDDPNLRLVKTETRQSPRTRGLILNTFEDLEGLMLSQIHTQCPNIYTIGPIHAHLNTRLGVNGTETQSSNSLWEVDMSCISWLDKQPPKSVIYVSFGSITVMTRCQFMEFWFGLVNSKKRFLWVTRPDSISGSGAGGGEIPVEIELGTKERGYMVSWAPQKEVLSHNAVGGFLTHSGWNSTLESIVSGVPMICWPYFADQQLNSRFVSEVWKLGLDMKDVCDRKVVEKMVNDLMVERREEFVRSTDKMARLAKKSVTEGGSSYCNLDRLIEDIRLMSMQSYGH